MFKLQVAAQHYESSLQYDENYFVAFVVGTLILSVGAVLSKQMAMLNASVAWIISLAISGFVMARRYKNYVDRMESVDQYLLKVSKGETCPPLKELIKHP